MEATQPTVKFEFTVAEINLILDALLDKPARQSIALIRRIEGEATGQLTAAAEKNAEREPE